MGISKTRVSVQEDSLIRRGKLLAYIEKHQPVSTMSVVRDLGYAKAVVFQWLRGMSEEGYVTSAKFVNEGGHLENQWSRGENTNPLRKFALGGGAVLAKDIGVHRRFTKAKQIGMQRCEFESLFFGAVAA